MRRLLLLTALLIAAQPASAATAFLDYERVSDDGRIRYCFYQYLGDMHVLTVRFNQRCPQSIEV